MKFLLIRFSSIGDIVLTSPIVRCLRKRYPESEIHYLTKTQFHTLLAGNPNINKLHLLDKELGPLLDELKAEKFDYVIDLHKSLRSRVIRQALAGKTLSFHKLNFQKWLLVNFKVNRLPDKHIVDRYFEGVADLDVQNDGQGLDYYVWEKDIYDFVTLLYKGSYTAFVIGAKHNTKRLPEHKIDAICEGVNGHIALIGGKEEAETGERMNKLYPEKVINLCGKLNLNESAIVVKNARKVIAHDTGLMHIAAAFKKPILSIWGNTVPEFGMYPYYGDLNREAETQSLRLEVKDLSCRPCSKIGYEKCPRGHFRCMNEIDAGKVVAWVNNPS